MFTEPVLSKQVKAKPVCSNFSHVRIEFEKILKVINWSLIVVDQLLLFQRSTQTIGCIYIVYWDLT